jgi:hypothetical protein
MSYYTSLFHYNGIMRKENIGVKLKVHKREIKSSERGLNGIIGSCDMAVHMNNFHNGNNKIKNK